MNEETPRHEVVRFGLFEADLRRSELRRQGVKIKLQEQPFQVLMMLLERPGEVVTREALCKKLWSDDTFVDFEHSLNTAIMRLREALGDSADNPCFVETVARRGYRFIAPTEGRAQTADGANGSEDVLSDFPLPLSPLPPVEGGPEGQAKVSPLKRVLPWAVGIAIGAILMAIVLTSGPFRNPAPKPQQIRFTIPPPGGYTILSAPFDPEMAISPDGRMIAFVATDSRGHNFLWVRALDGAAAHRLENTDGAGRPFWSPDSKSIGFAANGTLMRIAVVGLPQTICEAKDFSGGAWNNDDVILFGQGSGPVMRVSAGGGQPAPATQLEKEGYTGHVSPYFLPDGQHFLYLARDLAVKSRNAVFVGALNSKQSKFLLKNSSEARFYPPSHLLFVRHGVLMAQLLDPSKMELRGKPVPIAENVSASGYGPASFSSSSNGVLAYCSGIVNFMGTAQLIWYNRGGKKLGLIGPPGPYTEISLSPDEKRVAVNVSADPNEPFESLHIWLLDLTNGVFSRLSFGSFEEADPVWSPDSRQIIFAAEKPTGPELMRLILGSSQPQKVFSDGIAAWMDDWSPDGRFLAYHNSDNTAFFALPMTGELKPITLVQDSFSKDQLRFSPDGKWAAYNSSESGRPEVYVASFPNMDRRRQVSTDGGVQPMWKPDGKELFYLGLDGKMMAVNVTEGATVGTSTPKALFQTDLSAANQSLNYQLGQYAVAANGQKFLLLEPVKTQQVQRPEPIHVIVNWDAALAK